MSKQLYEEALADVKKLKEVAEDNAKRALLEAVTPRIKDLIENQLLGEAEFDPKKDDLLLDDPDQLAPEQVELPLTNSEEPPVKSSDEDATVSKNEDVYELSVESARALGLLVKESNSQFDKKLKSIARQLQGLSNASRIIKESNGFDDVVSSLVKEVEDMYAQVQEKMDSSSKKDAYESILENYYSTLKQLTEQKMKRITTLSEADVTMKLTGLPDDVDLDSIGIDLITDEGGEEGEEELDLGEEGEEEETEEAGDEEAGEEEEEEESKMESRNLSDDLVVEIDENMLRKEIARMKALREDKVPSSKGHGAGKVADGFEDEDMGDPFVDVELKTESQDDQDEVDEAEMDQVKAAKHDEVDEDEMVEIVDELDEYGMDEDDLDEAEMDQAEDERDHSGNVAPKSMGPGAKTNKQSRQPGKTVESLTRQLSDELELQAEAKKKATQAKKSQKEAQHKAKQKQHEAQQKSKQKKQQEAQKAKKEAQKCSTQAKKMQETYTFYAKQFNESVLRSQKLKGMLAEAAHKDSVINNASSRSAAETTDLRNKLAETNLFNTKLLFANKVLQNESFTRTQKAGIIERLDEARSEREVKLVYESLVKTLDNTTRRQVNESRERAVMGSSSRPTKPSSTLNEGFETDRWARLAGISK